MARYPHIIVRVQEAVYQRVEVALTPPDENTRLPDLIVNGELRAGTLSLSDPDPEAGSDWSEARREALIVAARDLVRSVRKDLGVVFGEADVVYLKRSGARTNSQHPPTGGIDALTGKPRHAESRKTPSRRSPASNRGADETTATNPVPTPIEFHYSNWYENVLCVGSPSGRDAEDRAYHFLASLGIRVDGIYLVEGDCPGNNSIYVKARDDEAVERLREALAMHGYEMVFD